MYVWTPPISVISPVGFWEEGSGRSVVQCSPIVGPVWAGVSFANMLERVNWGCEGISCAVEGGGRSECGVVVGGEALNDS